MRCNDFDAHIDEMLSGILHPDANLHMRQCERCTSHFRSRATVQNGLRQLASATLPGPSRATDRAVMEGYRRLQQRRAPAAALLSQNVSQNAAQDDSQKVHVLTFPGRGLAPGRGSRTWVTSAAAAAVVFAVLGSAVHLWNGVPTVSAPTNAPTVATAPAATAPSGSGPEQRASANAPRRSVVPVNLAMRRGLQHPAQLSPESNDSQSNASISPILTAEADANHNATPLAPPPANAASVMRLASSSGAASGVTGSMDQSASSTWPGYSNLMYCDPMVCSGPMQVVHIKVPIGQVKPNLGQTVGNGFVNAEVVVGPDGVARAIRVAN